LGKNAFKELKHIPIFQPSNLIFFGFLPDGSATATEFSGSELIVITNDCLFKMFTVADLAKTSLIYVSTFLKRFFDLDLFSAFLEQTLFLLLDNHGSQNNTK
jgi:hypothetical protein